jgi:hypothetical protein
VVIKEICITIRHSRNTCVGEAITPLTNAKIRIGVRLKI